MEKPSSISFESVFRALFLLALLGFLLGGILSLFPYTRLLSKLQGKSLVERGKIASDERESFLARAGRPQWRRELARLPTDAASGPSAVGDAWAWTVTTASELPPDARIYLNVPDTRLYYFGTTLWFPRPLNVSIESALVKDQDTLLANWKEISETGWNDLRKAGFTHVITLSGGDLKLIDLRGQVTGAAQP